VCIRGHGESLATEDAPGSIDVDRDALSALVAAEPRALGEARKLARFLAGISSPALVSTKLTRHALYGSLGDRRFREVVAFAERDVDWSRGR
jgi:hypothetical protein